MSDVKQLLTFPMIRLLQSHYRHKKLFSDRRLKNLNMLHFLMFLL